tara:strand:- start:503 stop:877 length:375 start_codon:yes stop_codon:yes gene_type:complete
MVRAGHGTSSTAWKWQFSALTIAGATSAFLYHRDSADAAEAVDWKEVRKDVVNLLENESYDDGSYGPLLVRLAWHASGTYDVFSKSGGSNGATMRYGPESTDGANAGLDVGRALLEQLKKVGCF